MIHTRSPYKGFLVTKFLNILWFINPYRICQTQWGTKFLYTQTLDYNILELEPIWRTFFSYKTSIFQTSKDLSIHRTFIPKFLVPIHVYITYTLSYNIPNFEQYWTNFCVPHQHPHPHHDENCYCKSLIVKCFKK